MNTLKQERRITTPEYNSTVKIMDDLTIACRSAQKKPTWYLLKLGNKWPRKSLGTKDLKEAKCLAHKAWQAWSVDPECDWLAATGNITHHVGFKQVAEEWLAKQTIEHANKSRTIHKFLIPFFHDEEKVTSMGNITDDMIEAYKIWRVSFWLSEAGSKFIEISKKTNFRLYEKQAAKYGEPSPNTLNREYPTLRQILKYAYRQGYFPKEHVMPDVKNEPASANPRPAFLADDFNVLMREANKWIAEADNVNDRMRRQLLADWIWVNRYTGLRLPHEAHLVTWADVRLDTGLLFVSEFTKTGKRQVPLNDNAAARLSNMKQRREAHCGKIGAKLDVTETVFRLENGDEVKYISKLFNKLVQRCNFPRSAGQLYYSPYSLRHTFATFSLAENKTYPWLTEVMGTSVKMLIEHYKHGTIEQTAKYLRELESRAALAQTISIAPSKSTLPSGFGILQPDDPFLVQHELKQEIFSLKDTDQSFSHIQIKIVG